MGAATLYHLLRAELHIDELAALPDAVRGALPLDTRPLQARPPRERHDANLTVPSGHAWSGTSDTYVAAYRSGDATPSDVVSRALAAARSLAARKPSVGPMVEYGDSAALEEAREATTRYREKRARGPLDGVPYVVKEQMSVRGFARRAGTSLVDGSACAADGTCIARLREAGAIVLGTTAMTEYGMTPIGANSHRTMPRNPHATDRAAGGSSTGSGVAVATGLSPFAIGADGGGSIRIPAAINGVFGIKPTWGRVSRAGDISTSTVAHVGPIASSTLDLARVLEVISGPDDADTQTAQTALPGGTAFSPGTLVRALGRGVRGLRIGVPDDEWRDASSTITAACHRALRALEREGAVIVPIVLPLAKLAPAIGYVSIGLEALASLRSEWRDHADEMSPDLQVTLAAVSTLAASEYADAQRIRSGLRRDVARVFANVDLMALPTTMDTATRVTIAQMRSGFLDAKVLHGLCRFNFLGNLTGLPALSCPVGRDEDGLPIGFQLVGDAWDEATVLAASAHLERIEVARVEKPLVATSVLRG